jgi:hypothetical protein
LKDVRLLFGGAIALILLLLYGYALIEAIRLALHAGPAQLKDGFAFTISTVGALVSALVIAELAIAEPGEAPLVRTLRAEPGQAEPSPQTKRGVALLSVIYVSVWILLGVAAFVVGVMLHAGKVPALTDFGRAWLGLAVAAGYSYFGIRPSAKS